jgi:hypothetical protein
MSGLGTLMNSTKIRSDEGVKLLDEHYKLTPNLIDVLKLAIENSIRFDPFTDQPLGNEVDPDQLAHLNPLMAEYHGRYQVQDVQTKLKDKHGRFLQNLYDQMESLNTKEKFVYNKIVNLLVPIFFNLRFISQSLNNTNMEGPYKVYDMFGESKTTQLKSLYTSLKGISITYGLSLNSILNTEEINYIDRIVG